MWVASFCGLWSWTNQNGESELSFIPLCFLTADALWSAASSPCCHGLPPWWTVLSTCEPKQTFPSLIKLCLVSTRKAARVHPRVPVPKSPLESLPCLHLYSHPTIWLWVWQWSLGWPCDMSQWDVSRQDVIQGLSRTYQVGLALLHLCRCRGACGSMRMRCRAEATQLGSH